MHAVSLKDSICTVINCDGKVRVNFYCCTQYCVQLFTRVTEFECFSAVPCCGIFSVDDAFEFFYETTTNTTTYYNTCDSFLYILIHYNSFIDLIISFTIMSQSLRLLVLVGLLLIGSSNAFQKSISLVQRNQNQLLHKRLTPLRMEFELNTYTYGLIFLATLVPSIAIGILISP